jgi:hypothetical protein
LNLRETQLLGPQYIKGLDTDSTREEVKAFILRMKNNKAIVFNGRSVKDWKIFSTICGGINL